MSATSHPIQIVPRLFLISRLPECPAIQHYVGIAGNQQTIRGRGRGGTENVNLARRCLPFPVRNRLSLSPCVLNDLELRVPPAQLLDPRNDDVELDSQLLENLPPLGRARR